MSLSNHKQFLAKAVKREAFSIDDLFEIVLPLIERVPELERTPKQAAFLNKVQRAENKAQRIKGAKSQVELSAIFNEKD